MHPAEEEGTDPALGPFLDLLARDIATRPDTLAALPRAPDARIKRLTAGVNVNPEDSIEGDVAL